MPKLKTHKSAQRRLKITGTGKIMRYHVGKSHLRYHKSKRVRSSYDQSVPITVHADVVRLMRSLPYGLK